MNFSQELWLKLMAYTDDELDECERHEIEALLASDSDAKHVVRSMNELGDWVRTIESERAQSQPSMTDAILRGIESSNHRDNLQPPRGRKWPRVVGSIMAITALAAGVLFMVRTKVHAVKTAVLTAPSATWPQPDDEKRALAVSETAAAPSESSGATAGGVEVDTVESPSHSVTVFYVPSAKNLSANASSVVVWIGDSDNKDKKGR